ncbi:MAG: TraI domain-containing protein [Betaproteobacteria bacterium]|nr:TraI domain-containing protein [Betaproteobacteria bacterium]
MPVQRAPQAAAPVYQRLETANVPLASVPMYPPTDGGIPIVSVDEMLASQAALLARLKIAGARLGSEFEPLILQSIRRYAAFVALLPASNSEHHRGAGGLFRLGLEVGFASVQGTAGVMFAGNVPTEDRRIHEDRWQVASFLAGLTCEMFRCATDMIVRSENGAVWSPYSAPLVDWAAANDVKRVYITWPAKPIAAEATRRLANSLIVNRVIAPSVTEWLNLPGTPIVPAMMSAIVGTPCLEGRVLHQLVQSMHLSTIERDLATQPSQYGRLTLGSHLEPYIIDAMRRLVRERRWLTNVGEAQTHPRLWHLPDGLFLVWSPGAQELIDLLKREGVPGIPAEPMTLVEVLHKANVIVFTDGTLFTNIQVHGKEKVYEAVRIGTPELIYQGVCDVPAVSIAASRVGASGNVTAKPSEPSPQATLPLGGLSETPPGTPELSIADAASAAIALQKASRKRAAKAARTTEAEQTTAVADSDDFSELSPAADEALEKLPNTSRVFLTSVFEDRSQNEKSHQTGKHPRGYAIAASAFKKYGLRDGFAVARELADAGWLALDPSSQGSQGRFVDFAIGQNEGKVIVLAPTVMKFFDQPKAPASE